jgi:hypothetical protein
MMDMGITRPTAATISKMSHAALPEADRQYIVEQKSRYEAPTFAPQILNKETKQPHLSVIGTHLAFLIIAKRDQH